MSLSRAVEYMGLSFDGEKHDALSDAENCARLLALMQDEEEFARRKALVPPEPVPVRKPRKPAEQTENTETSKTGETESEPAENKSAKNSAEKAAEAMGRPRRRRRHSSRKSSTGESRIRKAETVSGNASAAPKENT